MFYEKKFYEKKLSRKTALKTLCLNQSSFSQPLPHQPAQRNALTANASRVAGFTAALVPLILLACSLGWAQKDTTQNNAAPQSLDSQVVHRIQVQVRSRYNIPPQVEIVVANPVASTLSGYDQVTVSFKGEGHTSTHDFLISKDHKTLANLETMDLSEDLMSKINLAGRPVRGNPDAKVTVVVYDDFECPFCGRMYSTLFPEVFNQYKNKVRIVFKDYPLIEIHPWALHAAVDANCLAEQNTDAYWAFSDYVHANQKPISGSSQDESFTNLDNAAKDQGSKHHLNTDQLQACLKKQDESAVRAEMAEGDKIGVDSTPMLFIDGNKIAGAVGADALRASLDQAIAFANGGSSSTQHSAAAQSDSNKQTTAK